VGGGWCDACWREAGTLRYLDDGDGREAPLRCAVLQRVALIAHHHLTGRGARADQLGGEEEGWIR
jgi:hypothetical protein